MHANEPAQRVWLTTATRRLREKYIVTTCMRHLSLKNDAMNEWRFVAAFTLRYVDDKLFWFFF